MILGWKLQQVKRQGGLLVGLYIAKWIRKDK